MMRAWQAQHLLAPNIWRCFMALLADVLPWLTSRMLRLAPLLFERGAGPTGRTSGPRGWQWQASRLPRSACLPSRCYFQRHPDSGGCARERQAEQ